MPHPITGTPDNVGNVAAIPDAVTLGDNTRSVVELAGQNPGNQSVERPNLKDVVAHRLREMVFTGELRPGVKIDQERMATILGVSKLPVREALISLESEGLVESAPRRGSFVAPLTRDDVRDHYNIFGAVCGIAAERAAVTLTEPQLATLADLVDRMERSQFPEEQEALNFQFHRRVNLAGGGRRLRSVIRLLSNSIPTRFFLFAPGWADEATHDHRRILAALEARQPEAARYAVEHHLRDSGDFAVKVLEQLDFWSSDQST